MIAEIGELRLDECDSANIPVSIFYDQETFENEETGDQFSWKVTAENYMPRKSRVSNDAYCVVGQSKEELVEYVRKYVKPLYEIALKLINDGEDFYYWEVN